MQCAQGRGKALRRYDDPVEVRRGETEGPDQFLWRGRLWQVREVVAHWVETGAWWSRRPSSQSGSQSSSQSGSQAGRQGSAPVSVGDLLAEQEVWRVTAARGRAVARAEDPGFGVFDLSFDWSGGQWRLTRVAD
jgi:hypothetical protein